MNPYYIRLHNGCQEQSGHTGKGLFFPPSSADKNTAAPAGVSAQPASAREKKERKEQQEIKAEKEREASVRLDGYTE